MNGTNQAMTGINSLVGWDLGAPLKNFGNFQKFSQYLLFWGNYAALGPVGKGVLSQAFSK